MSRCESEFRMTRARVCIDQRAGTIQFHRRKRFPGTFEGLLTFSSKIVKGVMRLAVEKNPISIFFLEIINFRYTFQST